MVTAGYACRFGNGGCRLPGFCPEEFREWVTTVADADLYAVEAFLSATAATAKSFQDDSGTLACPGHRHERSAVP